MLTRIPISSSSFIVRRFTLSPRFLPRLFQPWQSRAINHTILDCFSQHNQTIQFSFSQRLIIKKKFSTNGLTLNVNSHCQGCGSILQTDDPQKIGFYKLRKIDGVPPSVKSKYEDSLKALDDGLEEKSQEITNKEEEEIQEIPRICERCFVLKNYGKVIPVQSSQEDVMKILESASKKGGVFVKIVDITDFNSSFIPNFRHLIGNKEVILVANKVDLLPKEWTSERLKSWIKVFCEARNFRYRKLFLVSSRTGEGIPLLCDYLELISPGNIYVTGATNSGKSTLINYLIRKFKRGKGSTSPTISSLPGTTLNLITIKLSKGLQVYDTPGIYSPQILYFLSLEEIEMVALKKRIVPKVYYLDEGKALMMGKLARLEFLAGPKAYFTAFFSNQLELHHTKIHKVELLLQKENLLKPPLDENMSKFPPYVSKDFEIVGNSWKEAAKDIVFPGIGWFSITGKGTFSVRAWYPKGVDVFQRDPLMPFETPKPGRKNKIRIMKTKPKRRRKQPGVTSPSEQTNANIHPGKNQQKSSYFGLELDKESSSPPAS